MDTFDDVRRRLEDHFVSARFASPASAAGIMELEQAIPALPEDLRELLARFDGFDLGLEAGVEGELLSAANILTCYPVFEEPSSLARLVPLRSDGCGNFDCVLTTPGPGSGAVVFWDHEDLTGPAYLLASSLPAYLDMLADYLTSRYRRDGTEDQDYKGPFRVGPIPGVLDTEAWTHPWPFDEAWLRERDPGADALLANPAVRDLLLPQGM